MTGSHGARSGGDKKLDANVKAAVVVQLLIPPDRAYWADVHHRAGWASPRRGLAWFFGEHQEAVVCGQVEVGIQAQTILVGEQADSLDVAQARLRVALLQHAIEFLVAIRGVSA